MIICDILKENKMLKITVCLCFSLCFSFKAFAVDGYKNLKFGMSPDDVEKSHLCSWIDSYTDIPDVTGKECDDFSFVSDTTDMNLFFIENKLSRVVIFTEPLKAKGVIKSLVEQYGKPTNNSSSAEEWKLLDTTPNSFATAYFDKNTVFVKITTDALMNQSALIYYTIPDYDTQMIKAQLAIISNVDI